MKYYTTKREAEDAAEANNYLLGQEMSPPYESYPITSITVEKAKKIKGSSLYSLMMCLAMAGQKLQVFAVHKLSLMIT